LYLFGYQYPILSNLFLYHNLKILYHYQLILNQYLFHSWIPKKFPNQCLIL
jgi:hypothetical protein